MRGGGIFRYGCLVTTLATLVMCMASATAAYTHDGLLPAREESVEELKARLSNTSLGERSQICLQIAQKQLEAADKLYAATESEKAQAALGDVTSFAEMARDYAIKSRKHQKQTEILVRRMAHKLNDLKHSVVHDDQAAVQSAMAKLQRISDDLLYSMVPKAQQK